MIRLSILAAATIAALSFSSYADAGGRPDLVAKDLQSGKQYVAGQLIVQYRSFATQIDKQRVQKILGSSRTELLARKGGKANFKGDIDIISFASGMPMQTKLNLLKNDPAIEYAEPNWIVKSLAQSNDPGYTQGDLWGMYGANTTPANEYGSGAGTAWANGKTNCSSVVVGVIDEGYMYAHPDLAANAYKNPGEIAGNGRDDDANGYVDDIYGWDFDGRNNTVFDGISDDHGTHVAGTIGAVGGNGIGVAGVCWNIKLMNAKFLGRRGGTSANAIKAIDYFTNLKLAGVNVVATNNSWGGGGFSQGVQDAIARANNAGVLFVAAAGNSGYDNDANPSYPSGYPNDNIISVAALDQYGELAWYSQYGLTTVDIGAPGSRVLSTVPTSVKGKVTGGYAFYDGTSMATPHVSGAAALYKALNPSATAAQIKAAILGSAIPTPSLDGKVSTGGRLNVSGF